MYLKHFGLNEHPFSLTPNLRFFCNLKAYKEALNVIMVSLYNAEVFVKITGEVGVGKTFLCRKLLNSLGSEYVAAYIANANLDIFNLQKAIAHELEISLPENIDNYKLINSLNEKLIELHRDGKRVVVIVDEAHILSDQALEGLRLLSNLETESSKLVQIILVGQPELDRRLKRNNMRQLAQRIVFSYRLPTIKNKTELLSYVCTRLSSAGYTDAHDLLFSGKAIKLLLKYSRGIPRLINVICHKALLITYGYNKHRVDADAIKMAAVDTESVSSGSGLSSPHSLLRVAVVSLLIFLLIGIGGYLLFKLLPQLI